MPIGTERPNLYPTDNLRNEVSGTPFVAVESRGGSRLLNWYASDRGDTFILSGATTINSHTFDVDAGHSIVAGEVVEFFENDNVFQAIVTNVATNTITIDKAFPYVFSDNLSGFSGAKDAAVDGSTTEVVYQIAPPSNQIWDLTTLNVALQSVTAANAALFGDLTELTDGITLRIWHSATEYEDIANFKSNADFFIHGGSEFHPVPNGTTDILNWSNKFNEENGGVIRLDGANSERLELVVSDNIAGLDWLNVLASGYVLK